MMKKRFLQLIILSYVLFYFGCGASQQQTTEPNAMQGQGQNNQFLGSNQNIQSNAGLVQRNNLPIYIQSVRSSLENAGWRVIKTIPREDGGETMIIEGQNPGQRNFIVVHASKQFIELNQLYNFRPDITADQMEFAKKHALDLNATGAIQINVFTEAPQQIMFWFLYPVQQEFYPPEFIRTLNWFDLQAADLARDFTSWIQ